MTVEQLINRLQELNPQDEVLIEINHDELVSLREDNEITIELVTEHNRIAFEDEDVEGNIRRAVVIRA